MAGRCRGYWVVMGRKLCSVNTLTFTSCEVPVQEKNKTKHNNPSLYPLLLFPHLLTFTLTPHQSSILVDAICLRMRERDRVRDSRVVEEEKLKSTCSISSICTMEGGTLARGRDSASSSFRLRVMMFLKWRRASWRTDGSFPCRRANTHVSETEPFNWNVSFVNEFGWAYLYGVKDGLQHGQNIAEEEVPRVGQGVQQLLTCDTTRKRINESVESMRLKEQDSKHTDVNIVPSVISIYSISIKTKVHQEIRW